MTLKSDPRSRAVRYVIDGEEFYCMAWIGDFDVDDNPIRYGVPYLRGERRCGHRDCVVRSHIIGMDDMPKNSMRPQDEVIEIRTRAAAGESNVSLAVTFNLTPVSISRIINGVSYGDIGGPIRGL